MSSFLMKLPPHQHGKYETKYTFFILSAAMLPAILFSIFYYGYRMLFAYILTMGVCSFTEWVYESIKYKKDYLERFLEFKGSVTAALIVMTLPPILPYYVYVVAALIASIIAKQLFGGFGRNVYNPAITGRIAVLVGYSSLMSTFYLPTSNILENGLFNITTVPIDAISMATTLTAAKETVASGGTLPILMTDTWLPSFLGFIPGAAGEVSALALLIGGALILITRIGAWRIPFACLTTFLVLATVFWYFNQGYVLDPITQVLSGGIILGSFFMATDFVTSPLYSKGKIIFGIGCGALAIMIRIFSSYPEGIGFSILLMNSLVPLIDRYTKPRSFGG